ncbi:glycosyltransferase family 39 protein, partial [Patescibacteria group bacterium]|nr:glycosyltransferase family 39 protein [Patescibacteria group bacterium]
FLVLAVPGYYNSPDENSNAVFTQLLAEKGQLHRLENLNLVLANRIHPRSVKVVNDLQVPGGFLGLPVIYGIIARSLGAKVIPFITPFIALLGVLAWGLMISQHFGRRVGVLAAGLLLVNPVWWYWSSHTMMPNVLLMSLLLGAAYFLSCTPSEALSRRQEYRGLGLLRWADAVLAGICLGLALAVRLAAIYWLFIAVLVMIVLVGRRLPWSRIAICLVFAWLVLAPFLLINQSLYGSWLMTGYGDVSATVSDAAHGGLGAKLLGPVRPILFPLGFAPRTAVANFWSYGVKLFWWWSLLVGLAGLYLWRRCGRVSGWREQSPYTSAVLITGLIVSGWLILFYGSWSIQDNPNPNVVTIGSSYLRYWLPIFILSTLPVAGALSLLVDLSRRYHLAQVSVFLFLLLIASISGRQVFGAAQEGLIAIQTNLRVYQWEVQQIIELTEDDALIVVDHADKYLYPKRAVMYPLRSDETYQLVPLAVANTPTYYFGLTFPERDLDWLQNVKLPPLGLSIQPTADLGEHSLYKFIFK